jgi:hypothetical protein
LKANLHLLGRSCTWGPVSEEYIAFSEISLSNGPVDFCVLCDRSRMAVVFIEIKGSDFSFLTKAGTEIASHRDLTKPQAIAETPENKAVSYAVERGETRFTAREVVEPGQPESNSLDYSESSTATQIMMASRPKREAGPCVADLPLPRDRPAWEAAATAILAASVPRPLNAPHFEAW